MFMRASSSAHSRYAFYVAVTFFNLQLNTNQWFAAVLKQVIESSENLLKAPLRPLIPDRSFVKMEHRETWTSPAPQRPVKMFDCKIQIQVIHSRHAQIRSSDQHIVSACRFLLAAADKVVLQIRSWVFGISLRRIPSVGQC